MTRTEASRINYVDILKRELENRLRVHPRYSLRAFARDLGIGPAQLCLVMNGKKGISEKTALKIAAGLSLDAKETESFRDLVLVSDSKSREKRKQAQARLAEKKSPPENTMALEAFRVISEWHHFAIMELTCQKGFISSADYIQDQLGISAFEAEQAIKRLEKLDLIEKVKGKWRQTAVDLSTTQDVPSEAIKKFHLQVLEKASAAIRLQTVTEREVNSLMIGIHQKDMPRYKTLIRNFHRDVNTLAESNKIRTHVYCLSTQFFKLSEGAKQ